MEVYINYDILTGIIYAWSSSPLSEHDIMVDVDSESNFLLEPSKYKVVNNELVEDLSYLIQYVKEAKEKEFKANCDNAILSGFYHTIDGIEYHFSFDFEAQLNFQGSERLLSSGVVPSILWTVSVNGSYTRIPIDNTIMQELTLEILMHKTKNIGKFRDILMPKVYAATTLEELEAITW